ncbi:DUF1028 domain-containing protein [Enterovirga sp. CN4-39]|uniref:DUF1028 domain-containing protein n=1 Tax=Enterovirga sp. CN4-39 TaxID=3400910 RepID=UPI003C0AFA2A
MTFSILGFCPKTGKTGFAQSTSTPAVGWRCTDVVRGRGVLTVQAHGDYRQLQIAKRLMELGHTPQGILKSLEAGDPFFAYRQIAILDLTGVAAVYTGEKAYPWAGEVVGSDHVATGNVLVGEQVVRSMSETFASLDGADLEDRLMRALEAGRDAGGQPDGQTSAAIVVYDRYEFPTVNLRVDAALEPTGELRRIYDWFKPLIPYYVQRTLDPTSVPRFRSVLQEKGLPQNPYAV